MVNIYFHFFPSISTHADGSCCIRCVKPSYVALTCKNRSLVVLCIHIHNPLPPHTHTCSIFLSNISDEAISNTICFKFEKLEILTLGQCSVRGHNGLMTWNYDVSLCNLGTFKISVAKWIRCCHKIKKVYMQTTEWCTKNCAIDS